MVYLDSCVLIQLIEAEDLIRKQLRLELSSLFSSSFAFTALTRLECCVFPLMNNDSYLLEQYEHFFALPKIEFLSLNTEVWDEALHIRAKHHLKTPDALHLAAANSHHCSLFCTMDKRLSKVAKEYLPVLTPMISL